ncbi:MAG: hypothetical protein J2P25_23845 [Nocardiopsaceae bacterium]|nr:hypothetical protein [Nocardiopsaceae bacterium]
MDTMADTQTERQDTARAGAAESRHRCVRLLREPAAAALARREVRAAIRAWGVRVDADVAVLLASDLVTDAIIRGEGETVTLAVRFAAGRLRVDVSGAGCGPGLALVATLADEWGGFRGPAAAAYFALGCDPDPGCGPEREEQGQELPRGDGGPRRPGIERGDGVP